MSEKNFKNSTQTRRPGRPNKTEVDGAELLLRVAQTSFSRSGFKTTSIREIAKEAGVHHALVIHHFGSKEELWLAVMDRLHVYLETYIQELQELRNQPNLTARDRVVRACHVFIAAVCGEPDCGMLMARVASERGEAFDLLVDKLLRPFRNAFVPILEDAIKDGTIPQQDLEVLYFMIFSSILSSITYRHVLACFDGYQRDLKKIQEAITQFIVLNIIHPNPKED